MKYLGIEIDLSRDELLSDFSQELLKKHYQLDTEQSPQQTFARAATNFCYGDYHLAQRIYDYVSQQYASFSSPICSNAINGEWADDFNERKDWYNDPGSMYDRKLKFKSKEEPKALPISCYLEYIGDSLISQINGAKELAWLSVKGGGIGQYLGMRGVTKKSPGAVPYLKTVDANILYYHQQSTRRGSIATYLDISHPDIIEYIGVRTPSGGDINRKSLNVHIAINITDKFLDAVKNDLEWVFIDPHTKQETNGTSARELWQNIIEERFKTGEPFLHFIDESNRRLYEGYKATGGKIYSSNLCLTGDTVIQIRIGKNADVFDISLVEACSLPLLDNITVKSYDVQSNKITYSKLKNAFLTEFTDELYEIEQDGKVIKCTANHKILTKNRGYIKAKNLVKTDKIVSANSNENDLIIKQIKLDNPIPVYDLTVADTHNFYANGLVVHNCTEIIIPTSEEHTAVCCLASLNLEKYDEWKDTTIVEDFTRFLDNVLQWFIDYAPPELSKAANSSIYGRPIGLGVMGWHNFLMRKKIPFESGGINSSMSWSYQIMKTISERAIKESEKLGRERMCPEAGGFDYIEFVYENGEVVKVPPNKKIDVKRSTFISEMYSQQIEVGDMINENKIVDVIHHHARRNALLLAPAPNANSAVIAQTSPSTEPIKANIYNHRTRVGTHIVKNPYLDEVIKNKFEDDNVVDKIWSEILANNGSIQNLEYFTDEEKKLFKTANEIDQRYIIDQARIRSQFIDQSQSVNLFFNAGTTKKEVSDVHLRAFSNNQELPGVPLKTLYYLRSTKASKIENVSGKIVRNPLTDYESQEINKEEGEECLSCQG